MLNRREKTCKNTNFQAFKICSVVFNCSLAVTIKTYYFITKKKLKIIKIEEKNTNE